MATISDEIRSWGDVCYCNELMSRSEPRKRKKT